MTRQTESRSAAELERQLGAYLASVRANVPSRWKKQLRTAAAYAAAAGSALALATTAEAGIMYSGIQNASVTLLTANNGIKSAARRSLKSLGLTLGLRFSQGDKTPGGKGSHAGSARLVALGTKNRLSCWREHGFHAR